MTEIKEYLHSQIYQTIKDEQTVFETPKKRFGCSELYKCPRALYYERKYGKPDLSHLYGVFRLGHLLEEDMLKILDAIVVSSQEPKIWKHYEIEIRAHHDGIIQIGDEKAIIEIKTCSNLSYTPYEHHKIQLNAYLHMYGYEKGYLIYIQKKDYNIHIVEHKVQMDLFDKNVKKCRKVYIQYIKDELPEREKGWQCKFCDFDIECSVDYNKKERIE